MYLSFGAQTVMKMLNDNGFSAYAVGGCVRDSVMGKTADDFDITTDAETDDMLKIFSSFKTIDAGIKHGTVGVIVEHEKVEVTTYRIDGKYSDSRHPDSVTFSKNLSDDLSRRDFTVNALACPIDGEIIDLFGGKDDIKNKIIRTIGRPSDRFNEDALRILRAMRFSSCLNFIIEDETKKSINENCFLLKNIAKERITSEIIKMITGDNIKYVLSNFSPVFKIVFPEIRISDELISKIKDSPKDVHIRIFLLFFESNSLSECLSNLRLSKKDSGIILNLSKMKEPKNKADIKFLLNKFGEESTKKYIDFLADDRFREAFNQIIENDECYSLKQLCIGGKDLKKLGFCGKEISQNLDLILRKVIKGELNNDRDAILLYLSEK